MPCSSVVLIASQQRWRQSRVALHRRFDARPCSTTRHRRQSRCRRRPPLRHTSLVPHRLRQSVRCRGAPQRDRPLSRRDAPRVRPTERSMPVDGCSIDQLWFLRSGRDDRWSVARASRCRASPRTDQRRLADQCPAKARPRSVMQHATRTNAVGKISLGGGAEAGSGPASASTSMSRFDTWVAWTTVVRGESTSVPASSSRGSDRTPLHTVRSRRVVRTGARAAAALQRHSPPHRADPTERPERCGSPHQFASSGPASGLHSRAAHASALPSPNRS